MIDKIVLALAVIILGGLTGWLTGSSGPDATVIASLLPALVPTVGVAAIYIVKAIKFPRPALYGGVGIVIFCLAVFLGINIGTIQRDNGIRLATVKSLYEEEHLQTLHLQNCSKLEKRINKAREALQLSPLPSEYFCKL